MEKDAKESLTSVKKLKNSFDYLWLPFTSFHDSIDYPPLIIERGAGIYIYDVSGKNYIDAIGSWWVSIFGHNHPRISNAVKCQLDKIEHIMMAGLISEPALRLSHILGGMLPDGLNKIFYSDDGSTAVEVALKIALQYHSLQGSNRSEFVAFDGGYHGDTLGAMTVGSIPQYHSLFHERFKSFHFANSPYCYRCPVGLKQSGCNVECMNSLKSIFEEKGDRIAGCIFEPMVQGAAGMRVYPSKVLERIFSLCKEFEILTIADEVAMGFGRTGKLFACEHAGYTPDIMCLAKGLTGGYLPLSATIVKKEIFGEFKGDHLSNRTLNHGHSFTGNPLAAAAACASMELIKEYDVPSSLYGKIAALRSQLDKFSEFDIVGDVRTLGMVGAIELVADKNSKKKLPPELRIPFKIAQKALKLGVIIRPLGDVLYFMPPFISSEEEIEKMTFLTHRALKEILDEEYSNIRSH